MQTLHDRNIFLSTLPATAGRSRRAAVVVVVGISLVLFALVVPYAGIPLTPVPAFVAAYQSALAINDVITAVLLLSQFAILRSRALLVLAAGYLFTAPIALVHALTFPGLFAPTGLLGAGPQTTVWLYMIWHTGFPLFVLAYALAERQEGLRPDHRLAGRQGDRGGTIAAVVLLSCMASIWVVVAQHDLLPALVKDGHETPIDRRRHLVRLLHHGSRRCCWCGGAGRIR